MKAEDHWAYFGSWQSQGAVYSKKHRKKNRSGIGESNILISGNLG